MNERENLVEVYEVRVDYYERHKAMLQCSVYEDVICDLERIIEK